jgi:hypothetical protein
MGFFSKPRPLRMRSRPSNHGRTYERPYRTKKRHYSYSPKRNGQPQKETDIVSTVMTFLSRVQFGLEIYKVYKTQHTLEKEKSIID